jgi:alkanesulfonate monooxygenase SsuD/methylene tetrahydromethanopterin reductase-like flavin-dependent oxidoreductase (luciferase family)
VRFGIHNSSWLDTPDPAEAFEAVKAKAQWAEDHGFVWFSVLDHMIQIPRVGAPDEPFLEGWTVLSGLAAVTSRIRLATLATAVGYRNPAHLAKIAASVDLISRGRLTLGIGAGFFEDELGERVLALQPGVPHPIARVLEAGLTREPRHSVCSPPAAGG